MDAKANGERIGAVVRTRTGVRPMYVSQGHRVSLETAIRLTLQVAGGCAHPAADARGRCVRQRKKTKVFARTSYEKNESGPEKFQTAEPGLGGYNRRDTLVSPQDKNERTEQRVSNPFAAENSMKRMGIVCCSVLTLVLPAVPLLAQQSPSPRNPGLHRKRLHP